MSSEGHQSENLHADMTREEVDAAMARAKAARTKDLSGQQRPAYCKCAFTDPDGTFVPGESCAIHPDVTPQRTALTSNQDPMREAFKRYLPNANHDCYPDGSYFAPLIQQAWLDFRSGWGARSAVETSEQRRLVHTRQLLDRAIEVMTEFHAEFEPDDSPELRPTTSVHAFKDFVDRHARLMFERAQLDKGLPLETSGNEKGLAVVRATQLDQLAQYLQRHQFDAMATAARESAKLLRGFAGIGGEETSCMPEGGGSIHSTDHAEITPSAGVDPARQSGSPGVDPSGECQVKASAPLTRGYVVTREEQDDLDRLAEAEKAQEKRDCVCKGTCERNGRPFPENWHWRCKGLPMNGEGNQK